MANLEKNRKILFWGGRSKSRLMLNMLDPQMIREHVIIYDSSIDKPPYPFNGQFIKDFEELVPEFKKIGQFATCIGNEHGFARYSISNKLEALGLLPLNLKHDQCYICHTVELGKGYQIMPSVTVNSFVNIGDYAILNTGCIIDHECNIGHGVHIMGGATLAGRITIEDFATVGSNATILPDLKIGKGAFIGAGAVVTRNISAGDVVVGNPADYVRKHIPAVHEKELLELDQLIAQQRD